jgi:DNA ligase (NAD+)
MTKTNQKLTADETLYLKAKETYYKGQPIMTDEEFDILEDVLRGLDSFVLDIVGAGTKKKKGVVSHKSVMGSLAKIQFKPGYVPYPEFQNWLLQIPANTSCIIGFEPKLDGNAINIEYEAGKLKQIASRGDGQIGQDYTDKLRSKFPAFIKDFTGEIRGEAVIDQYLFDSTYKKDGIDPNKKYTNARNFVAGALTSGNYIQDIDIICFEIVGYTGNTKKQLAAWGFEVHDFMMEFENSQLTGMTFVDIYNKFAHHRINCKYQLDGIVAKMTEDIRSTIGRNDHHPFWALAIKFETTAVVTQTINIEWTLGKRGQLTPVAILTPVQLLGSTVQKASLYNASWMVANKCYPGASVSLIKSGDIIPKIVEVIQPSATPYALPTEWNGKPVTFDGVNLMLIGFEDTDEYKAMKLSNQVVALGIERVGPAACEKLAAAGLDLKTLLSTNPDGLRMLLLQSGQYKDGRDLEIILESIFALTTVELWKVIYSMQYKNCGRTISKQLANWMTKVPHDFSGLEKTVVENFILSQARQEEVKELVGILLDNNVQVIKPTPPPVGLITFEMTGDCTTHPTKGEFQRVVEATGKCAHASLSKDTTYLVTNSTASMTGKMQKAMKNGTKIVTYDEFLDLITK